MKKLLVIIDPGHGGVKNGVYQTPGKRATHNGVGTIYEGEFNRKVAAFLGQLLDANADIDYKYTVKPDEVADISLGARCRSANSIYERERKNYAGIVFLSIHGNAAASSPSSARGWEVFTTPGQNKADVLAEFIHNEIKAALPGHAIRADKSDGDHDKEARFYVLEKTLMPAVLTENFFMTNPDDCRLMLSTEGQQLIASAHYKGLVAYHNHLNSI